MLRECEKFQSYCVTWMCEKTKPYVLSGCEGKTKGHVLRGCEKDNQIFHATWM